VTSPLHPTLALAPLRAVSEASLTDVGIIRSITKTRIPTTGEYQETPNESFPVACSLRVIGAAQAEIAAAKGIEAQFLLDFPIGTAVVPGNTVTVYRSTTDEQWSRTVKVTGVDLPNGIHVTCTAVDTALNQ
jgi:hypothetical protein